MKQTSFPDSFIPQALKTFDTLENDGTRLIFINGVQVYCLELTDEVSCRHAAVQLYLCWQITQEKIASAWKATVRTINSWVKKYRAHGIDGLKNKVQGPPVKISSELRKKVLKKRQDNWKVSELCQHFSLRKSAVYRILDEHRKDVGELLIDSKEGSESIAEQSVVDSLESQETIEKLAVPEELLAIDPMNRSADRFYAQLGLLEDAVPVFAPSNHVEWAGGFLAVALLSKSNFFDCASKVFVTIGPAFYGLRNVFMSFFLMAILRIKNPEQLHRRNPQKLGRILGLDRAPSVKTLRRKIRIQQRLTRYNYDVVIGTAPFDDALFDVIPLGKNEAQLAVPKQHPLAKKISVGPKDLQSINVVALNTQTLLRSQLDEAMNEAKVAYTVAAEVMSLFEACLLVAQGVGVTLADQIAAAAVPSSNICLIPWRPKIMIDYVAFTPRTRRTDPLTQEFIGAVRRVWDQSVRSKVTPSLEPI